MRSTGRHHPFNQPRTVVGVPVHYWNELVEEHNMLVEYYRATAPIIREEMERDIAAGLYTPTKKEQKA